MALVARSGSADAAVAAVTKQPVIMDENYPKPSDVPRQPLNNRVTGAGDVLANRQTSHGQEPPRP
jgi:hypothetical protein